MATKGGGGGGGGGGGRGMSARGGFPPFPTPLSITAICYGSKFHGFQTLLPESIVRKLHHAGKRARLGAHAVAPMQ